MKIGSYSVEVLIHGKPCREFSHYINGEYKTFIEGRDGTNYSLKVKNHTGEKLLAISSVDGLNVVTGDLSDGYKGRGYIIQPYGEVTIKGFRESDESVGSFVFTNKGDSYASERGFEKNCGVIAVNLINEKPTVTITTTPLEIHHHHDHYYPEPYIPWSKPRSPFAEPYWIFGEPIIGMNTSDFASSNVTCTANLSNSITTPTSNFVRKADFDLGTKWGERVDDKITRKHFDKNIVVASFRIYYATRSGLENIGINFYPRKEIDEWPEGFTGDYCKPPKGWR